MKQPCAGLIAFYVLLLASLNPKSLKRATYPYIILYKYLYIYIYTHITLYHPKALEKNTKRHGKQRGEALPDRVEPAKKAKRISSAGARAFGFLGFSFGLVRAQGLLGPSSLL